MPFVRLAKFEIDPDQLGPYVVALKAAVEQAILVEPGLLGIYAVAEKDNPSRLTFFEIYIDEAAHRNHIESAHFLQYRAATEHMVRLRVFIDILPILNFTK